MYFAVSALAALAVCGVVGHWVLTRVDTLGRVMPFPAIRTASALVVAVAALVPGVTHHRLETQLAQAATRLVGHPVTVGCQTLAGAWTEAHAEAGYVYFSIDGTPEPHATITKSTCDDLAGWLRSDKLAPSQAEVVAVHVLTHEAMHLRGISNEAIAECAAVQRDARAAELLGATPQQARALARSYWDTVYPQLPDAYRSGECAAGQPWDEGLPAAPWPVVKKA